MAVKTASRLEANKEARRIFVRHGIDTTKVHFSCHGKSLLLTGGLYKETGEDIESKIIEVIFQELSRMGLRITCELENWTFSDGSVSKKGPAATDPNQKEGTEANKNANSSNEVKQKNPNEGPAKR